MFHVVFRKSVGSYLYVNFSGLIISVGEERELKHYENMSMQYTAIFHGSKNEKFWIKNDNAQNIDCGYTLEPPK